MAATRYYCKAERASSTWTCKIYTGGLGGTLIDTLSLVSQNTTLRYLLAGMGYHSGSYPWASSGDARHFDTHGPAPSGNPWWYHQRNAMRRAN